MAEARVPSPIFVDGFFKYLRGGGRKGGKGRGVE